MQYLLTEEEYNKLKKEKDDIEADIDKRAKELYNKKLDAFSAGLHEILKKYKFKHDGWGGYNPIYEFFSDVQELVSDVRKIK